MNGMTICGYLWSGWVVLWILWAFQSKKTLRREDFASRMPYTIMVLASGYMMFNARSLGGAWHNEVLPYHPWLGWLGAAITVLGFAITIWARFVLGGNWSGTVTIKVGHELIRTGPYHWVRHPIYTGILTALVGTAFARDQWRGVAAVLLLWIGFTLKRHKEEQFMRQTFGTQYIEYARTTGAIFPSVLRREH